MIAVIRIKGECKVRGDFLETLDRLNLKKKYTCVVFDKPNKIEKGMIEKVRNFVAFGELDEETYKKLVKVRGKQGTKFFRLHPPRGGIDSKQPFGVKKGVLGDNKKEINKLVERML